MIRVIHPSFLWSRRSRNRNRNRNRNFLKVETEPGPELVKSRNRIRKKYLRFRNTYFLGCPDGIDLVFRSRDHPRESECAAEPGGRDAAQSRHVLPIYILERFPLLKHQSYFCKQIGSALCQAFCTWIRIRILRSQTGKWRLNKVNKLNSYVVTFSTSLVYEFIWCRLVFGEKTRYP
jgi:hypothetical protein